MLRFKKDMDAERGDEPSSNEDFDVRLLPDLLIGM